MSATSEKIYFKGLNGIRALAAIVVLIFHAQMAINSYYHIDGPVSLSAAGGSGVTLFFTLSGFLITYLLLAEKEKYGKIDFKKFYMRRILRIWPLYYFYILLLIAIKVFILHEAIEYPEYIIFFILFLPNIPNVLHHFPHKMGHLWSIGIEEQFYAFWPLVVNKAKRLSRFLFIFISVLILIRFVLKIYSVKTGNQLPLKFSNTMRYDCMAIGALFAIAWYKKTAPIIKLSGSIITQLVFWLMMVLLCLNKFNKFSFLTEDVVSVITGFYILSQVGSKADKNLMENSITAFLGKISYGIYMYHPLILLLLSRVIDERYIAMPSNSFVYVSIVMAATVLLAWASYQWLEKPFLNIKTKFMLIKSTNVGTDK